jgi:predicted GIY-YIG superfamily endonuclease
VLYLICFEKKLADHAQHYLGFVEQPEGLERRLRLHRSGKGAKILRGCERAGIRWRVARTLKGDRTEERRLKRMKRNFAWLCPCCQRAEQLRTLQLKLFA